MAVESPRARVLNGLRLVPGLESLPLEGLMKKLFGNRVAVRPSDAGAASGALPGWAAPDTGCSSSCAGSALSVGSSGPVESVASQASRPAAASARMKAVVKRMGPPVVGERPACMLIVAAGRGSETRTNTHAGITPVSPDANTDAA